MGIVVFTFEHNSTRPEAHCKEAAIIASIGLRFLDNQRAGFLFGTMKNWSKEKISNFGLMLIFKAFAIFAASKPPILLSEHIFIRR